MPEPIIHVEPTGIEGLDTILGGGIPVGSLVILMGIPGSGKTILSQQLSFAWLNHKTPRFTDAPSNQGEEPNAQRNPTLQRKVLFFTTFSEPHDKLIKHLSRFQFFDPSRLNNDFKILSLSGVARDGFPRIGDLIIQTVLQEKAQLVVIDSLGSLESEPAEFKHFVYRLSAQLNTLKATVIISLARAYQSSTVEDDLTFADGIIGLSSRIEGVRKFRRVEVLKMRGMNHVLGLHPYNISDVGLTFYPRLETWVGKFLNFQVSNDRLGFGLPELEQLLKGGLARYSSTVLAGAIGTGKTLSSLYFLLEGARQGENGLYVGFYESEKQLINKAANLGLDLKSAVESGKVTLLNLSPVEIEPDWVALRTQEAVTQHNIQRLVIDGFEVVERVCRLEGRSEDFILAFVNHFKNQGITAIYTHNIGKLIGTELDLSNSAFASLAENLLLLKQVELNNKLYRILAVLKMRDSDYDPSIRQFVINEGVGIRVLNTFESAEGLLSGLARSIGGGVTGAKDFQNEK